MARTKNTHRTKKKQSNANNRSEVVQKKTKRHEKEEIQIDLNVGKEKYDESNPLVYDASKKKNNSNEGKEKKTPTPKPLSKKQRKKLEKVLERRKKKFTRAELFEKLSQVQAKPEELKILTSTSTMQTYGLKRSAEEIPNEGSRKKFRKISNIKGINKKNKNDLKLPSSDSSTDTETSDDEVQVDEDKGVLKEPGASEIGIEAPKEANVTDSGEVKISPEAELPKKTEIAEPVVFVTVHRKPEIQAARESLPIFSEEQSIIEAIRENPVVIIHGETGSGKTTQVPQFLYEAGFTKDGKTIGITEPRRIAAMAMAARVGEEMNAPEKVSYHIRYERTVGKDTEIKFMTDGVLLKEIRHDFFLTKYSIILIDEAHERSVFSDVLIGLLSRIILVREKRKNPLKLVIMSATINVDVFMNRENLFKIKPFLIRVTSRQHRVQVHFNLQTPSNYVDAAYHKVCKIHQQLPPGAILVFLTGEKEVQRLCKLLVKTFPFRNKGKTVATEEEEKPIMLDEVKKSKKKKHQVSTDGESESFCDLPHDINLDDYAIEPLDTEDLQHQQSDDEETEATLDSCQVKSMETQSPLYVLPLYSILPFKEQEKVFKPPPTGSRLCVVATNVAETSITIPGLKYVVDSGKVKQKVYSENGGISQFQIHWCSKASSNQRAGRCGRTEGGHCYRLYSSAVFQEFDDFTKAEIETIPVDDVLLQMKALGIDRVVQFPFPTPPDPEALKSAEKRLVTLGALQDLSIMQNSSDDRKKWEYSAKVTPLGKAMSRFPLSPRYAKMLLLSYKHKCIPYMVAIVCAFTVPELFVTSTVMTETKDGEEEVKVVQEGIQKFAPGTGVSARLGDVMVLLQAVASFENSRNGVKFCFRNGIHFKAMSEIHKMGIQLLREMNRAFPDANLPMNMKMEPPSTEQVENIRAIVAACLIDNVARKLPRDETKDDRNLKNAYQCLNSQKPVFIHPSSTLFSKLPEWVVCNEMKGSAKKASIEMTGNTLETPDEIENIIKVYMKGMVEIESEWLPAFFPSLCEFSKPSEDPPPRYNGENGRIYCHIGGTFGPWQWNLPMVSMEMQKGEQKFSLFCFFLLDGQICPFFNNYKTHYLSSPSIMMKNWASLLPRTRYLLNAVKQKRLDSRESLRKVWEADPKYLFREFCEWLPVDKHTEVELQWPPKL